MRSLLFWDITQRRLVVSYGRFGINHQSVTNYQIYVVCNIREERRSHKIMSIARNMHNIELADTVFVIQGYVNTTLISQACYFWLNCTKSRENFTPCWLLHSSDVTTSFARIWSTFHCDPDSLHPTNTHTHTHSHSNFLELPVALSACLISVTMHNVSAIFDIGLN